MIAACTTVCRADMHAAKKIGLGLGLETLWSRPYGFGGLESKYNTMFYFLAYSDHADCRRSL